MKTRTVALATLTALILAGCATSPPEVAPEPTMNPIQEPSIMPEPTQSTGPISPDEEEPAPEGDSDATVSQQNAIKAAENYLSVSSFSEEGLIKQLEFEGYSTEDASYAVNTLEVDWNEQAASKAEEYLDVMPMSGEGLQTQLEFDGFTPEQAAYGVSEAGL